LQSQGKEYIIIIEICSILEHFRRKMKPSQNPKAAKAAPMNEEERPDTVSLFAAIKEAGFTVCGVKKKRNKTVITIDDKKERPGE
jgi:uncharacterized protein YpmB